MRIVALVAIAAALVASLLRVFFSSDFVALPHGTEVAAPRIAGRVLFVIFDGLRYDTALESDLMPTVRRLADAGASGLAMATEVTMTEVGVRTLGTGATPSLVDYLFPAGRAPIDSPLTTLSAAGGHVMIVGTGTWRRQFGSGASMPTVECGVNLLGNCPDESYVEVALKTIRRRDWDLAVVHLPGLDTASHRYTAFTEPFRQKARTMDALLARMVQAAGAEATVVVTSDHGTGERGHHGSGEEGARRTPLVLSGPGIAPTHLSVWQNDVAPTLAVLLGLPIPAWSEGVVPVDALAVSPAVRAGIVAANRAQLTRYVNAFARLRGVPAPTMTGDLRAAARFVLEVRGRASEVPLLWATALAIGAALLVVRVSGPTSRPALALWSVLAIFAALCAAFAARSVPCAIVALAATALGFGLEPRSRRFDRLIPVAVIIAIAELVIGVWRVNHREVQLAVIRLGRRVGAEEDGTFALLVVAGLVVTTVVLRLRPRASTHPWHALAVLVLASVAGDTLALPVGIGAGAAVAFVAVERERLPEALFLVAAFVMGLGVQQWRAPDVAWLGALPPLACGALALLRSRSRSRVARGSIVVLTLACVLVRVFGTPPNAFTAVLVTGTAALVLAPLGEAAEARIELAGWLALVLVGLLCQPIQAPGVLAVALCAREAGSLVTRDADADTRMLRGALLAVAVRLALLAVFERDFSFSRLEIWLAFMGNDSGQLFALGVILLKLNLAFLVAVALVTAQLDPTERALVVRAAGAFMLLRVFHIVLSMTIARGTYYSPNADTGPLLFMFFMAASLLVVAGVLALCGGLRSRVAPAAR